MQHRHDRILLDVANVAKRRQHNENRNYPLHIRGVIRTAIYRRGVEGASVKQAFFLRLLPPVKEATEDAVKRTIRVR
jgi:hypothetical protein